MANLSPSSGDQTLFVRADEVEAAWRLYTPVLARLPQIHPCASDTWGPSAADEVLAKHGHQWFLA